jgi:Aldehyde dehydrogenase family
MTGQMCLSLTRIVVPKARHDEFLDALSSAFSAVRVGDRYDTATQMGPLVSERQRNRVESYIAKGVVEGAVLATGGGRPEHLERGCAGCDHFRTDVSYLPDLHAYLDDLLRNRERVLAAAEMDQWARAESVPSTEEITTIRSLIARIEAGMEDLTAAECEQIDQSVATVRRHRTVTLGMPRMRQALPGIRPERTA